MAPDSLCKKFQAWPLPWFQFLIFLLLDGDVFPLFLAFVFSIFENEIINPPFLLYLNLFFSWFMIFCLFVWQVGWFCMLLSSMDDWGSYDTDLTIEFSSLFLNTVYFLPPKYYIYLSNSSFSIYYVLSFSITSALCRAFFAFFRTLCMVHSLNFLFQIVHNGTLKENSDQEYPLLKSHYKVFSFFKKF